MIIDIGSKFERLTVIEESRNEQGHRYYICVCDCGNKKEIRSDHLIKKETRSCGCLVKEFGKSRIENLSGKVFGRLTVIELDESQKKDRTSWICKCNCGNTLSIIAKDLVNGHTKSCGCLPLDNKRLEKGESAFNDLYSSYMRGALKRNLSFELSREEFREMTKKNCFYCGKEPAQLRRREGRVYGEYVYNGIDRIDNNKGYILENCVPCCGKCNQAKSKSNKKDFIEWIKKVFNNLNKTGEIV